MQPCDGHRAGLDALLLAATVPNGASGRLLDMGAGTGAAGLAAADLHPALDVTLAERDPVMLAALDATLHLPDQSFAARARVVPVDLEAPAVERERAGLRPAGFQHALANPPFNPPSHRPSPDTRRAAAHGLSNDTFEQWCRTAAHALAADGALAMILRPASLPDLLAAWRGRFGGPTLLPVHTRPGGATRLLARGVRGARAPLALLPSLSVDAAMRAALGEGTARIAM